MNRKNKLTRLLQIDYPVVQAPMLGVSGPAMAAAVSNLGGLGSLPVGGLPPERARELIRATKALTNKPFAVNLFAHAAPASFDKEVADRMQQYLQQLCEHYHLPFQSQDIASFRFYSWQEQVEVLLEEQVHVVSFTFGVLSDDVIKLFKEKGIVLIGTATAVQEALLLEAKGIDVITAQGIEAGGHRGTFIQEKPLPLIGSMSLIPLVADAVKVPVLAAGGVADARAVKAAFILGASGVQVGTAFIGTEESIAIPSYKAALSYAVDTDLVLTNAFSGRWARGIRNTFITEMEHSGVTIPAYPVLNKLTTPVRTAAIQQDNKEFTALWAGQSASIIQPKTTAEVFARLIAQTENL